MKTKTYILRYIVPFEFLFVNSNKTDIVKSLFNDKWEMVNTSQKESDLYLHICNAIKNNSINNNNLGMELIYKNKEFYKRKYKYIIDNKIDVCFEMSNVGAYLFYSKVGFIWYEIEICNENNLDIETLIKFQNEFKELGRYNYQKDKLVMSSIRVFHGDDLNNRIGDNIINDDTDNVDIIKGDDKDQINKDFLEFWNIGKIAKKENDNVYKVKENKSYSMGYIITELLEQLFSSSEDSNLGDERKSRFEYFAFKTHDNICVPDKALLYNYYRFDKDACIDKEKLKDYAYYLAKGYSMSYDVKDNIEYDMYIPFNNAYWYASREGCGHVVQENVNNSFFYSDTMKNRIKEDYFLLYILLLHQSYTLIHFSKEISLNLSANANEYMYEENSYINMDSVREELKKLKNLDKDINVFLLKSVHSSVSHVQHHNDFYKYIENQLCIRDDISSITMGLDAMKDIEEKYLNELDMELEKRREEAEKIRDGEVNMALNMISLLAIFSALIDGTDFADKIYGIIKNISANNNIVFETGGIARWICNGIVLIIILVISLKVIPLVKKYIFKSRNP